MRAGSALTSLTWPKNTLQVRLAVAVMCSPLDLHGCDGCLRNAAAAAAIALLSSSWLSSVNTTEVESKDHRNLQEEAARIARVKEALAGMRKAYADVHQQATQQLEEVNAKIAKLQEEDVRLLYRCCCFCCVQPNSDVSSLVFVAGGVLLVLPRCVLSMNSPCHRRASRR